MKRLFLAMLVAPAAFAQSSSAELKFFFNGAGVALHTESTASRSPISTAGSVSVGKGPAYRVVLDAQNNPLFAYELQLVKGAAEMVTIRIAPIEQAKAQSESWYPRGKPLPTIAAERVFPPLKPGDQVQVDIMQNPSTGEKLRDVLRVIEDNTGSFQQPKGAVDRFSFERVNVTIDGKLVAERPGTWMIGQAIRMRIRGRGDYYLVLSPPTTLPFQAIGWADHNVLRFKINGEQIEITGKSNILQRAEYGTVWVYFEPDNSDELRKELARASQVYSPNHPHIRQLEAKLRAQPGAAGVEFSCADNIDQIYEKRE